MIAERRRQHHVCDHVSFFGSGIPRFCGVCGLPCFQAAENEAPNKCATCGDPVDPQYGQPRDDAQGQTTKYVRDASNRVSAMTDAVGRTARYQYDAVGNKLKETDPLGRVTDYTYDPAWNKAATITRYLPVSCPRPIRAMASDTRENFWSFSVLILDSSAAM